MTGVDEVGGLVGYNYDPQADGSNAISDSIAHGAVTATGSLSVGGLVGWNNGPISDSAALNPSVTGVDEVGGLVGTNKDETDRGTNTIDRSISTANVMGEGANAGGLAGWNNGPIRDSYASGTVQSNSQVGGLIGGNDTAGRVMNSRADGAVGAVGAVGVVGHTMGGLVGWNLGSVTGSVATGAVTGTAVSSSPRWPGWRQPGIDQRQCRHRRGQRRLAGRRAGRGQRQHHFEASPRAGPAAT